MAQRKLQTEIDKTLKKVQEGVELFESIYDKMMASTNSTQKDKCENDLKTQIKKLQRLRDQIKTWLTNSDIKDKTQLMDTRKLIETQMERFKATEKEMKTKAFSKEGLIAATKLDPAEKAKMETINWLSSMIDELSRQVEQAEAEVETLVAGQGKRKGRGPGGERAQELEHLNERRKWHIGRMELVQRMLDNGGIAVDKVNGTKEDISYFVESNTEEDFEEDEGIYDELELQEDDDMFGMNEKDDMLSSHDSTSVTDEFHDHIRTPAKFPTRQTSHHHDDESSSSSGALARRTSQDEVAASSPAVRKTPSRKTTLEKSQEAAVKPPPIPSPNFSSQPKSNISSITPAPPKDIAPPSSMSASSKANPPTSLPAIRYAAAAAAAVSSPLVSPTVLSNTSAPSEFNAPPSLPSPTTEGTQSLSAPSPPPSHLSTVSSPSSSNAVPGGMSFEQQKAQAQEQARASAAAQQAAQQDESEHSLSNPAYSSGGYPSRPPSQPQQLQPQQLQQQQQPQQPSLSPLSTRQSPSLNNLSPQPQSLAPAGAPSALQQQQGQYPRPGSSSNAGASSSRAPLPNALADLVTSFETAKTRSAQRSGNMDEMHSALDASYQTLPRPADAEKPRYYVPKQPFQTPNHYPQEPFAGLHDKDLYSKLDLDTLFYIFYYHSNTYEQWLAARELKKQSWRFHKQYLTWFQRLQQPQAITDDYEQGMYIYFDWEQSWVQRKKGDFRFQYAYLSED